MNVLETMVVHGSVTTLLDPTTASVQLDLLWGQMAGIVEVSTTVVLACTDNCTTETVISYTYVHVHPSYQLHRHTHTHRRARTHMHTHTHKHTLTSCVLYVWTWSLFNLGYCIIIICQYCCRICTIIHYYVLIFCITSAIYFFTYCHRHRWMQSRHSRLQPHLH